MVQALPVGRLVRVTVNLSPLAAARRGFGTLLIAGASNVIDGLERLRSYSSLDAVATDFGTSANEYLAAQLYFGQTPRPATLMIGRWINAATSGMLKGGILTAAEQLLTNFTAISTGNLSVTVDGVVKTLNALDFSAAANLNAVAGVVNTALAGSAICTWDGSRFKIVSATTGVTSTVSFATTTGVGVFVGNLFKFTSALASPLVPGYAAETPVAATAAFANNSGMWYGLMFAETTLTDQQHIDVAALVEGLSLSRLYGVTITNTNVLDPVVTNDLGSALKALLYRRTTTTYSPNPFAIASAFGRAFSVNFAANRSTITLMYKLMPGVVAQILTEDQAAALKNKRVNVFAAYQNDTAIYQYGVMSGPAYFDEMHGLDWFADSIQNSEYNLLYQSATKIPQTDPGANQLVAEAASVCDEAVNNGLCAPGQWNADGFGQLQRGQYLNSGYYIYTQPMALQAQAIRETRVAPPLQIALKLAGAIQEIDAIVTVNR